MKDRTLQTYLDNPQTELEREIARLGPWFHNLHLPDGTQTAPDHPLGDFPSFKWQQIAPHVPDNLEGWQALDIGCNAGFYSFELARRGAQVTGIDLDERYLQQASWAAGQFGLANQIQFAQMQVYELGRTNEMYDLVWFMGVLYHLRYPQLALDIVARKVKRLLVFQSLMMKGDEVENNTRDLTFADLDRMDSPGWPKMAFIEHDFEGDPTNWWLPNHACMEAMLRNAGLEIVARPAEQIYVCRPQPESAAVRAHTAELRSVTGFPPR